MLPVKVVIAAAITVISNSNSVSNIRFDVFNVSNIVFEDAANGVVQ